MSAATSGLASGFVLGIVLVLLGQQFGFLELSVLNVALESLIVGAIVGSVLGGLIGWRLGAKYRKSPSAPISKSP